MFLTSSWCNVCRLSAGGGGVDRAAQQQRLMCQRSIFHSSEQAPSQMNSFPLGWSLVVKRAVEQNQVCVYWFTAVSFWPNDHRLWTQPLKWFICGGVSFLDQGSEDRECHMLLILSNPLLYIIWFEYIITKKKAWLLTISYFQTPKPGRGALFFVKHLILNTSRGDEWEWGLW